MRGIGFHHLASFVTACGFTVFLGALSLLPASCATTKLTGSWKDEAHRETFRYIVVVGAFEIPDTRVIFEEDFRDRLKERGVNAINSYKLFPGDKPPGKDVFLEKIRSLGADGVLVTRIVDSETMKVFVPGTAYVRPSYYDYYGTYYSYIYKPGYTIDEGHADAETNLYDVKSEKLVWTARSRTQFKTRRYELIQAFDKVMIEKLSADRLIP
jgi:hypothetical protein